MFVLKNGASIRCLFDEVLAKTYRAINAYDYKQLKEYSDVDLQPFVEMASVEKVVIDFDNKAVIDTTRSTMEKYNHFRMSPYDTEKFIVDSLNLKIQIPVTSGYRLLKYVSMTQTTYFSGYEDTSYSNTTKDGINYLIFTIAFELKDLSDISTEERQKKLDKRFDDAVYYIRNESNNINRDIEKHNQSILAKIKDYIEEKIKNDSIWDDASKSFGIDIFSKNQGQEQGKKIIITPKPHNIVLPDKKTYDGYYIEKGTYSSILNTIRNHLISSENLPKPVQKLEDEELIRDTILWALNTNYILATGETFRSSGKTDICVNVNEKTAFIAECKIWKGAKYFQDAITQIYSYRTWRDCKIAVILFNLINKDFGSLRRTIEEEIGKNPLHISTKKISETEWECRFKDTVNEGGILEINFLVANYYIDKQ